MSLNSKGDTLRLRDDDDDDGTNDDDDDGERKFTQAEVNKMMAQHKRQMQTELKELKTKMGEESEAREELEDMLIEAAGGEEVVDYYMKHGELPPDDTKDDDDDDEGLVHYSDDAGIEGADSVESLIKGIQKRADTKVQSLEKKLEKEIEYREDLEQKRLEQDRDQLLADALVKNNVVDVKAGLKLFRENMEFDPEEESWKFKTDEGLYMDPGAGLAESLPDWLRKPMGGPGGSGARGSSPSVMQTQLQNKKKQLGELGKKAQSTGDARDIAEWQRLNREVKDLETSSQPPGRTT
jgi:hypothetical protein